MNLQQFRQQYPQYNDMSDEALLQGLHSKYYSDMPIEEFTKIALTPTPTEPVERAGLAEAFTGAIGDYVDLSKLGVKTPFTGAEEAYQDFITEQAQDTQRKPGFELEVIKAEFDKGNIEGAKELMRQLPGGFGEAMGMIAPSLAAGVAGTAMFGPIGGIFGLALASFFPQFGGNISRQAEVDIQSGRPVDIDTAKAALATIPQVALDSVPFLFGPFRRLIGLEQKMGKQAFREKIVQESKLMTAGKGTGLTILTEVPTEIAQQIIERAQADLPLFDEEAIKEYQQIGAITTLTGPLGWGTRVLDKRDAKTKLQEQENTINRINNERKARDEEIIRIKLENINNERARIDKLVEDAQLEAAEREARKLAEITIEDETFSAPEKSNLMKIFKKAQQDFEKAQAKADANAQKKVIDDLTSIPNQLAKNLTKGVQKQAVSSTLIDNKLINGIGLSKNSLIRKQLLGLDMSIGAHRDQAINLLTMYLDKLKTTPNITGKKAKEISDNINQFIGDLRNVRETQDGRSGSISALSGKSQQISTTQEDTGDDGLGISGATSDVPPTARGAGEQQTALEQTVLQNRDRSTDASVQQMQEIASNLTYEKVGPDNSMVRGAPIVTIPSGLDEASTLEQISLGKKGTAVAEDGTKVPFTYAVVDARDVIPSNDALGRPNQEYAPDSDSGLLAVVGNGRTAGIQAAYERDSAQDYFDKLTQDTSHGVEIPESIERPMLVRIATKENIPANIGQVSNESATLELSATDQAAQDARNLSVEGLDVLLDDNGNVTQQGISSFIQGIPTNEKAKMLDSNGQPTKAAVDRLQAAIFSRAYKNSNLVDLAYAARDTEAKNVLTTLSKVASKAARLEGLGEYDVRDTLAETAELAISAKRNGLTFQEAVDQADMTASPEAVKLLEIFARNPRSVRGAVEELGRTLDTLYNEATKPASDMYGDVPKLSANEIIFQEASDQQGGLLQARGARAYSFEGKPIPRKLIEQHKKMRNAEERTSDYASGRNRAAETIIARNWLNQVKNFLEIEPEDQNWTLSPRLTALQGILNEAINETPLEARGDVIEIPGQTVEDVVAEMRKAFGGNINVAINKGLINVVESTFYIPENLRYRLDSQTKAVFDPATNKAYFIANRIPLNEIRQTILHEIGAHYGLSEMIGDANYKRLQKAVLQNKDADPVIKEAIDFVKDNYSDLNLSNTQFAEEVIARIGETAPESNFFKRIIEAIKNFIRKLGLGFNIDKASAKEIAEMVSYSTYRALKGRTEGRPKIALALASENAEGQPIFYSELKRAIINAPQEQMPPAQWASWLKANAPKLKVKQAELDATTILDYLKFLENDETVKTDKVTKADLAEYLSTRGFEVSEVIRGYANQPVSNESIPEPDLWVTEKLEEWNQEKQSKKTEEIEKSLEELYGGIDPRTGVNDLEPFKISPLKLKEDPEMLKRAVNQMLYLNFGNQNENMPELYKINQDVIYEFASVYRYNMPDMIDSRETTTEERKNYYSFNTRLADLIEEINGYRNIIEQRGINDQPGTRQQAAQAKLEKQALLENPELRAEIEERAREMLLGTYGDVYPILDMSGSLLTEDPIYGEVTLEPIKKYGEDRNIEPIIHFHDMPNRRNKSQVNYYAGQGEATSIIKAEELKEGLNANRRKLLREGVARTWEKDYIREYERATDNFNQEFNDLYGGASPTSTRWEEYTLEGGDLYTELLITIPKNTTLFEEDVHFPTWQNVIAFTRFKRRFDKDGKKVLFVEEIQSDWAQQGRKYGFVPTLEEEQAANEEYDTTYAQYRELSKERQNLLVDLDNTIQAFNKGYMSLIPEALGSSEKIFEQKMSPVEISYRARRMTDEIYPLSEYDSNRRSEARESYVNQMENFTYSPGLRTRVIDEDEAGYGVEALGYPYTNIAEALANSPIDELLDSGFFNRYTFTSEGLPEGSSGRKIDREKINFKKLEELAETYRALKPQLISLDKQYRDISRRMELLRENMARANEITEMRGKVTPAPFVTKTNDWVDLTLKRLVAFAVDNGYDRLAITDALNPALRSLKKYDPNKATQIIFKQNETGNYDVSIIYDDVYVERTGAEARKYERIARKYYPASSVGFYKTPLDIFPDSKGTQGAVDIYEQDINNIYPHTLNGIIEPIVKNASANQLEAYVGKTLATLLLKEFKNKQTRQELTPSNEMIMPTDFNKTVEDTVSNLIIPTKAMRDSYNRIYPQELKKISKQLGGSELITIEFPETSRENEEYQRGKYRPFKYTTAINLTDQLKENVAGGIPLFARGDRRQNIPNETRSDGTPIKYFEDTENTIAQSFENAREAVRGGWTRRFLDMLGNRIIGGRYSVERKAIDAGLPEVDARQQGKIRGDLINLQATNGVSLAQAGLFFGRLRKMASGMVVADESTGNQKVNMMNITTAWVNLLDRATEELGSKAKAYDMITAGWYGPRYKALKEYNATVEDDKKVNIDEWTESDERTYQEAYRRYGTELRRLQDMRNVMRKDVLDFLVDAGLYTREKAEAFLDRVEYVALYRVPEEDVESYETKPFIRGAGLLGAGKEYRLVGSQRAAADPIENYIANMSWLMQRGIKNNAAYETARLLEQLGEGRFVNRPLTPAEKKANHHIVIHVEGKPKDFIVNDPNDMAAFASTPVVTGFVWDLMKWPVSALRHGVTMMPQFVWNQAWEDPIRATLVSGNRAGYLNNIAKTWKSIATNQFSSDRTPNATMLNRYGIIGQKDIMDSQDLLARYKGQDKKGLRKYLFFFERMAQGSDLGARESIYDNAVKELTAAGYDEATARDYAALRAHRYLPYQQVGQSRSLAYLRRMMPFINPPIQGLAREIGAMRGRSGDLTKAEAIKAFAFRMAKYAFFTGAYAAFMSGDDDYEDQPEDIRDNNFFIGDLRIPVPRELAPFKVAVERGTRAFILTGDKIGVENREAIGAVIRKFYEIGAGFLPIPTVARGPLEIMTNYDFFTGRPLESAGLRRLEKGQRYTENTSELAKVISNSMGNVLSPIQVDKVLSSYFGYMGKTLGEFTNYMSDSRADRNMNQLLFIGNVFQNQYATGPREDFYQLFEKTQTAVATANKILENEGAEAYVKYVNENRGYIGIAPTMNKLNKAVTKIREARRVINTSTTLTSEEKRKRLNELQLKENEILNSVIFSLAETAHAINNGR